MACPVLIQGPPANQLDRREHGKFRVPTTRRPKKAWDKLEAKFQAGNPPRIGDGDSVPLNCVLLLQLHNTLWRARKAPFVFVWSFIIPCSR